MTVTKAERSILNLLWEESPRTLGEIIREIKKESNWSDHAISVLLSRLTRKGAVMKETVLGLTVYAPVVSEKDIMQHQRKGIRLWHRLTDNEAILLVNTKRVEG